MSESFNFTTEIHVIEINRSNSDIEDDDADNVDDEQIEINNSYNERIIEILKDAVSIVDNRFNCSIFEDLAGSINDEEKIKYYNGTMIGKQELLDIHRRNLLIRKFIIGKANVFDIHSLATKFIKPNDNFNLNVEYRCQEDNSTIRKDVIINQINLLKEAIKMKPDWYMLYINLSNVLVAKKKSKDIIVVNGCCKWDSLELLILSILMNPTSKAYIDILLLLDQRKKYDCMINFKTYNKKQLISSAFEIDPTYYPTYHHMGRLFSPDDHLYIKNTIEKKREPILKCLQYALNNCISSTFQKETAYHIYYGIYFQMVKMDKKSVLLNDTEIDIKTILSKSISNDDSNKKSIYKRMVKLLDNDNDSISFSDGKTLSKLQMLNYIQQ